MTFSKLLLPILTAACLSGCVYEEYETGYQAPRRAYHGGGYAQREVAVERQPVRYYDDRPRNYSYYDDRREPYYEERPRVYYDRRPQPYVSGVVVHHDHPNYRGESAEERRRREIREAQRRAEDRKKDDDKKKKKKKKND